MRNAHWRRGYWMTSLLGALCLLAVTTTKSAQGQGIYAIGAGPINLGMAGASVAAPVDFGSSYWNPANLSGLKQQEVLIGSQLIIPSAHIQTFLPAGAIGGVLPQTSRYGQVRNDGGVASNLAVGGAFRLSDDSPLTFGIGIFGVAGGGVNYAGSSTAPLLSPHNPPKTFGYGPIFSNMSILTINPTVSLRLSERLSVAAGPTISSGTATFSPAYFAPSQGTGAGGVLPSFPNATANRPFWGGGFQVGMLFEANENWNFGFAYKSPIWQERWSYNATYPDLSERRIGIQASLPSVLSWGIAYKGIEKMLIDIDFRYMDYADAALFGQSVANGGLGWKSVFAVATGYQYQVTDRLTLRAGYLFNTNPIRSQATLFNVQAPGITTNTLSLGSSFQINEYLMLSGAWVHGFRNSIQGGVIQEAGAGARFDVQSDSIVLGLTARFGKSRALPTPPPTVEVDPAAAPVVATTPVVDETAPTPDTLIAQKAAATEAISVTK